MGDHDRRSAVGAVPVRGFERLVFGVVLVGVDVDAVAGGVTADCQFSAPLSETGLVAAVGGGEVGIEPWDVSAGQGRTQPIGDPSALGASPAGRHPGLHGAAFPAA